jgi:integrase
MEGETGRLSPKLSDKIARSATPPSNGNHIVYDSETKGFGLRVTANGARSFILNYRNREGIARRLTIGSYPDWAVAHARTEAVRLKQIVDRGGDPLGDQRAHRSAPDVNALAERYLTEHAYLHKRASSVADDQRLIRQWIGPELGARKVEAVSFTDVAALHRRITLAGTPIVANRCMSLLSKMFNLARRWQWRQGENPARDVQRNAENRRERPITPAEMTRLHAALDAYPRRSTADAIRLLILTGARTQEVLQATRCQFDLAAGTWTKPSSHTKQKRLHRVPLVAAAVELLANQPPGAPAAYVFPGLLAGRPLADLKRPWREICAAAGIPTGRKNGGITPHDLRHTFGTTLGGSGASLPVIGALLGHTQASTTLRYVHMYDDPLRAAAEQAAARLNGGPR